MAGRKGALKDGNGRDVEVRVPLTWNCLKLEIGKEEEEEVKGCEGGIPRCFGG